MQIRHGLTVLVLALASGACSIPTSDGPPVDDSTLVDVMVELHLVAARQAVQLETPAGLRDSVLVRYGLDREHYEAALAYYAEDPDAFLDLYDRVLDRLHVEAMTRPEALSE